MCSEAGVDGKGGLHRTLHSHEIACNDDSNEVEIGSPKILSKFHGLPYPYALHTRGDALKTLGDMFNSGWYAWDTQAMQVNGSANSITPRSSLTAYRSDVRARKMGNGDVVEIFVDPVDKDLHCKKVSVLPFDSQNHNRKEIWLTISQVDGVMIQLRAVSQKQEDELMELLNPRKHHYGAGHITVANPVSGRFWCSES